MTEGRKESNPARFVSLLVEGGPNGWTQMLSRARDRTLAGRGEALTRLHGSAELAVEPDATYETPFARPDELLRQLRMNKAEQQEHALRTLQELPPESISSEIRSAVVELLSHEDEVLRDLATSVICRLGPSTASPALSQQVTGLLSNRSGVSWDQGLALIQHVGAGVITGEVRHTLQRLAQGADAIARNAASRALRQAELAETKVVFQLRAAAGGSPWQGLYSVSECGLWELEVYVGTSAEDRIVQRGSVVITVHPDNRTVYEGATASVFVDDAGGDRLLAEGVIADGKLELSISLAGLDFQQRHKIWVTFRSETTKS